jgi:hypothetical protein
VFLWPREGKRGETAEGREEAVGDRRSAIANDMRALADDLKSLLESATTDPKERKRKERRWKALYAALGIVTTLAARQVATKAWGILTGERPPTAQAAQPAPRERAEHAIDREEHAITT